MCLSLRRHGEPQAWIVRLQGGVDGGEYEFGDHVAGRMHAACGGAARMGTLGWWYEIVRAEIIDCG
jgi:hypothetical protein